MSGDGVLMLASGILLVAFGVGALVKPGPIASVLNRVQDSMFPLPKQWTARSMRLMAAFILSFGGVILVLGVVVLLQ